MYLSCKCLLAVFVILVVSVDNCGPPYKRLIRYKAKKADSKNIEYYSSIARGKRSHIKKYSGIYIFSQNKRVLSTIFFLQVQIWKNSFNMRWSFITIKNKVTKKFQLLKAGVEFGSNTYGISSKLVYLLLN